jgi:hypothetical protein
VETANGVIVHQVKDRMIINSAALDTEKKFDLYISHEYWRYVVFDEV